MPRYHIDLLGTGRTDLPIDFSWAASVQRFDLCAFSGASARTPGVAFFVGRPPAGVGYGESILADTDNHNNFFRT